MKISQLISALERTKAKHGDIHVTMQTPDPKDTRPHLPTVVGGVEIFADEMMKSAYLTGSEK
jgi:hypothetical protein